MSERNRSVIVREIKNLVLTAAAYSLAINFAYGIATEKRLNRGENKRQIEKALRVGVSDETSKGIINLINSSSYYLGKPAREVAYCLHGN